MDPSSLVFAAIIGVWAAYLVPAWLRRRMQIAESRSRDRFSAGVRVLNRRRRARRAGLIHRSGGAVLTAPRASSGFVRAEAGDTAGVAVPAGVAEVGAAEPAGPVVESPPRAPAPGPVPSAPAGAPERSVPGRATGEASRARARAALRGAHAAHVAAVRRARLAAARRFRALIALLFVVAAAWTMSMATAFRAWIGLTATALLALNLTAGRVAAIRSKRALDASHARVVAARQLVDEVLSAGVAEAAAAANASEGSAAAAAAARPVGGVGDPWLPVPVPPPTYTLKPAVHRPEPSPLPSVTASTSAPAISAVERGESTESVPGGTAPDAQRARGRGALPRRAEEIERILDLDALERRTAVNG